MEDRSQDFSGMVVEIIFDDGHEAVLQTLIETIFDQVDDGAATDSTVAQRTLILSTHITDHAGSHDSSLLEELDEALDYLHSTRPKCGALFDTLSMHTPSIVSALVN